MRIQLLLGHMIARTSIAVVVGLGLVVWTLAFVGFLSLTGSPRPVPVSGIEVTGIPGLPVYPGAQRSEFRAEVFGDERVTEVEYVVDSDMPDVREYYHGALARGGWDVTDTRWVYGEWVYTLSSGDRHGVVEIEHRDGVTEIEVEMIEPALPASGVSDG